MKQKEYDNHIIEELKKLPIPLKTLMGMMFYLMKIKETKQFWNTFQIKNIIYI